MWWLSKLASYPSICLRIFLFVFPLLVFEGNLSPLDFLHMLIRGLRIMWFKDEIAVGGLRRYGV